MLARSGFSLPTRTTLTGDWADLLREHFVALDVSDIGDGDRFSGAVHSANSHTFGIRSSIDGTTNSP